MIRDRITQFINTYVRQIYVSRGGVLLGRGTGAGPAEEIIIGAGLTLTAGTLTAAGGGSAASDEAYNAGTWDGVTTVAPSKNAVRDKFVSVDAAIAGKQAADDDLTDYANAADAAARRALIGAVGTALEITTTLQDLTLDPLQPTKISKDFMPPVLELNSLLLGEVPSAALTLGTLSRVGTSLRIHDGTTEGGNPVETSIVENTVPYHRSGGIATIVPFGQAGSRVKQAGTRYWQEIGRVKIPASEIVNGATLSLAAELYIKSAAAVSGLARSAILVPSLVWDVADQSTFFGASPSNSVLNAASPAFFPFRLCGSSSQESVSRTVRTHVVSYAAESLSFASATAGTYQYGYDWTAAAAFTGTDVAGTGSYTLAAQADLELVIVAQSSAGATDYRKVEYAIEVGIQ